ncbi:MAG: energy transducer TonB [Burkholderiaceae bacterium]
MDNQKINLMFIPQIEITKAQDLTKITEAKFKPIPSETKTKTKTKSVKKKKTMKNLPEETKKDNDMEESIEIQDSVLINNDPRSKLVESFEDVKTPPNNYPQTKDFSMKLIKTRARIGSDLTQCKPNYPRVSKRRGEQGTVILRFLINEKGRAEKAEIKQTSGYTRLDNSLGRPEADASGECGDDSVGVGGGGGFPRVSFTWYSNISPKIDSLAPGPAAVAVALLTVTSEILECDQTALPTWNAVTTSRI